MASDVEKGRRRQAALFEILGQYQAATTDQLAALLWGGDQRLARAHLLRYAQEGQLRRLPHPIYRHGPYVYTRTERTTAHSPKILHHLATMDFYLVVVRHLARYGARVVVEMPWGPGLIPDQTVLWRESAWAVEHHLSGQFAHAGDYQRFMEEEQYELCSWWRPGMSIGLLVATTSTALEPVRSRLRQANPPGLTWRVATREAVLRDPGVWLRAHEKPL